MGDDTTESSKPCVCGQGEIITYTTTPDHGWVSAYNVHQSFEIKCPSCAKEYALDGARVVRRVELAEHNAAHSRYWSAHEAFTKSSPVVEVKKAFGERLDAMPSRAAIHRYLQQHHLDSYSIGSFRRHWVDGEGWASTHVHTRNLSKVLELLGRDPASFDAELGELARLNAAIPQVKTVINCL